MSNTRKAQQVFDPFAEMFVVFDKGLEESYQKYLTTESLEDKPTTRAGFYAAVIQAIIDDTDMDDEPEMKGAIIAHLKQMTKKCLGESVREAVQAVFKETAEKN